MPELDIGHVERCGVFAFGRRDDLIGRDEKEFSLRINELLDQPGARHSVDLHVLPGDPFHLFASCSCPASSVPIGTRRNQDQIAIS